MKKSFFFLFAFFVAIYGFSQPDLLIYNARVWTGESTSSFQEAIAIKGDRIAAVGSSALLLKSADARTQKIDAGGKLVMAGFDDAHIHFLSGSLLLTEVSLFDASTVDEIQKRVVAYANSHPQRTWVTGRGWLYGLSGFGDNMPRKELLDQVMPDRPVFFKAYDGHTGWANSKALALAGIDKNFKFTGYGEVLRDATGEPTGVLTEGAQDLIVKIIPEASREEKLNALRLGLKLAASLGITTLQNASGSPEEVTLYEELAKQQELTTRIAACFSLSAQTSEEDIKKYIAIRDALPKSDLLRVNTVKFMFDGVIESHTAAMLAPYADAPAESGDVRVPVDTYQRLVTRFDKEGFQIFTHAIGDRAVRLSLDAYELAKQKNGTTDRRHRIEHIETINPADMPRFNKIGVLASMEPIHADPATIDIWANAIGKQRLPNSFAWASLLKAKAHLVYSSDWPAAIAIDPIRGIHVAVNRRTPDGKPAGGWIPEQKISMFEALKAYTQGGAYSSHEETSKGKLLSGYKADVIMLSENLFTIEPMSVYKSKVLLTVMNGKIVYQAP